MHAAIPELDNLIRKMDAPALVLHWGMLKSALDPHIAKEEASLFPALEALTAGRSLDPDVLATGEQVQAEHQHIHALAAAVAEAAAGTEVGEEVGLFLDELRAHAAEEDAEISEARLHADDGCCQE